MAEAVESAREACTALRWHPALRRLTAQAQAESIVRAARASAALDGADLPLAQVRELVAAQAISPQAVSPQGISSGPDPEQPGADRPVEQTVVRALRATATAVQLGAVLATAPAQALARLHLAAAAQSARAQDELGRPRAAGVASLDLVDLGTAPSGAELAERLDGLSRLILQPTSAPALVLAAVVHGELLSLRPFPSGNGLVARAMMRSLIVQRGLDPTGVAVAEVGLLAGGTAAYIGAAAAYGTGTPQGLALWITHCASAVRIGAAEGALVADAVLAGKLPG